MKDSLQKKPIIIQTFVGKERSNYCIAPNHEHQLKNYGFAFALYLLNDRSSDSNHALETARMALTLTEIGF
ncbi:hypothetical protein T4B_2642 [Trichinella pseudospiralis]|uniref:Uncharacterized protein n=1 Tax=Trichinella pseudospiralis TaxID=6337 RepID=A0A0V1HHW2_TRIPS|nr:hypothetical protein T4B_2642 [Trichinella pseudospiralis]